MNARLPIQPTSALYEAVGFARAKFEAANVTRKYTGEPYIDHVLAVCAIVASVEHTEEMLAAAMLRDLVKYAKVWPSEIRARFGHGVADLVGQLTDFSGLVGGDRTTRKAICISMMTRASDAAKTIELAKMIENVSTITDRDPAFARTYLQEQAQLLDVLQEGNEFLWKQAWDLLVSSFRRLGIGEAIAQ